MARPPGPRSPNPTKQRTIRVLDADWLPALRAARHKGVYLSEVIAAALRAYARDNPVPKGARPKKLTRPPRRPDPTDTP